MWRWKICTTLNDLYSFELFVHRSMICTTLNDLCYVEWFLKICATLNDSYSFERIVLRWMVQSVMDDLYKEASCGLGCLLSIGLLMSARCDYLFEKFNIFYTNLWIDISLIWKYQEKIDSAMPKKLVIKRCFWSL